MPTWTAQDEDRFWDVAIIGAGMGGGLAARTLADAGLSVLLIDRGKQTLTVADNTLTDRDEILLSEGKWPTTNTFVVDGQVSHCAEVYGTGVGGSTNLYAAALERFEPHDFDASPGMAHPTGGWPISYAEFKPFYEQAERMLHVAGTRDPLSADAVSHLHQPPPLGPSEEGCVRSFTAMGMHPYRLHVGIRYRPGCDECLGRICHNNCRADVRSVLAEGVGQPTILDRSEVLRLEASADKVECALLVREGQNITVRAKLFVLAAGAVQTPKLLLQSAGEQWPDGLANESGMVGRNLMFHALQKFVLWPGKDLAITGPRKTTGFRDLYRNNGERLGSVQSTGFDAGYGDILMHFYSAFDQGPFRKLRFIRPFLRIPAALISYFHGRGTIFVCVIEDLPYPENRIVLDPEEASGTRILYNIKQELRDRLRRFRSLLSTTLAGHQTRFLTRGVDLNFSHACGTCVMGDDPSTSVVDRDCRAHGISNLYIADASFMPTSAATNPGLTIAANALRVAGRILASLSASRPAISILSNTQAADQATPAFTSLRP